MKFASVMRPRAYLGNTSTTFPRFPHFFRHDKDPLTTGGNLLDDHGLMIAPPQAANTFVWTAGEASIHSTAADTVAPIYLLRGNWKKLLAGQTIMILSAGYLRSSSLLRVALGDVNGYLNPADHRGFGMAPNASHVVLNGELNKLGKGNYSSKNSNETDATTAIFAAVGEGGFFYRYAIARPGDNVLLESKICDGNGSVIVDNDEIRIPPAVDQLGAKFVPAFRMSGLRSVGYLVGYFNSDIPAGYEEGLLLTAQNWRDTLTEGDRTIWAGWAGA